MHHKPNTEIYGEDILGNRCHQTLGQNQKYITIFTKEKKRLSVKENDYSLYTAFI